ncbi:hypothetical protein GCM10027028_66430 [Streptomyces sundarbansensis]
MDLLTRVQAIDNTSALNLSPSVSLLVVSYSLAANNLTFLSHRKTKGKHRKASWNLSFFENTLVGFGCKLDLCGRK